MSAVKIRAALEAALATISPALDTVLENDRHDPPASDVPYQRVAVLFAEPANYEMSASYTERGFMQVTLCYPQDVSTGAAMARAELIRATFKRTATFTFGGVTVRMFGTPEIRPGFNDGDRFVVPVRIRFTADITV